MGSRAVLETIVWFAVGGIVLCGLSFARKLAVDGAALEPGEAITPFLVGGALTALLAVFHARRLRKLGSTVEAERAETARVRSELADRTEELREQVEKRLDALSALRRAEALFAAVCENAPDPIWVLDRDRRLLIVNPAAARFLKLPKARLVGGTMADALGAEFAEALRTAELRALGGQTVSIEIAAPRAGDGPDRMLDGTMVPLRDRRGRIVGVCVIGRDVDGRQVEYVVPRLSARHRRREDSRLRPPIDQSCDAVFRIDLDHRIVEVSSAMAALLGRPAEALVGRAIAELLDDPAELRRFTAALERGRGRVDGFESAFRHPEGGVVWLDSNAWFRRGDDGRVDGIEGIARDVTANKVLEWTLRDNRLFLESIEALTRVGAWVCERPGDAVTWSAGASRIIDCAPQDAPDLDAFLVRFDEPGRAALAEAIRVCFERAEPFDLELGVGGTGRVVRVLGHPVPDGGTVARLRGAIQDRTAWRDVANADDARSTKPLHGSAVAS